MRIPRLWVGLVGAVGLVLAGRVASGAGVTEAVEQKIKIIEDLNLADDQRIPARISLLNDLRLAPGPVAERILKMAKDAPDDSVRVQAAILFVEQWRGPKPLFPAALNPEIVKLQTAWLEAEGSDAALRYWAAVGLAQNANLKVVELLKAKALTPDARQPILRSAVAMALAKWSGDLLIKQVVPILLEMLGDKDPEIRTAGCDALWRTKDALLEGKADDALVVEPLLVVARTDPEEPVWRAAATALPRIGGGRLQIKGNATNAERLEEIKRWEDVWRSKKRREERGG